MSPIKPESDDVLTKTEDAVSLVPVEVEPTKHVRPVLVRRNPKGAGRPSKKKLKEAKAKIGRPKNDTGRIAEFKQRLLGTSGEHIIKKLISIAQEDGNPGQMAALKMCVDRILPISMFEKDSKGQRNAVTINITGIGEVTTTQEAEIVDMDEDEHQ